MQNEGVGADVSSYHQPPTIHLLTKSPDVNGQRSQVSTCWDENIRQEDRTAKVQRDEATSSWGGGKTRNIHKAASGNIQHRYETLNTFRMTNQSASAQ